MSHRVIITACLASALTLACGRTNTAPDETPPQLQILTPERGTRLDAATVAVEGTVTDQSAVELTINGQSVEVIDGAFSAVVPVDIGVTMLHTHAIDAVGHEATDTRSVLNGTATPYDTPVTDALAVRVNKDSMHALGLILGDVLTTLDYTALASDQNPVLDTGSGCFQAQANVTSVSTSQVEVDLATTDGGVDVLVTVHDLSVSGDVDFEAVCIGGSTSLTASAQTLALGGSLQVSAGDGVVAVEPTGLQAQFNSFNLDINNVPGEIDDLLASFDQDLADALVDVLAPVLSDFLKQELELGLVTDIDLVDETFEVSAAVAAAEFTEAGGTVSLDAGILPLGGTLTGGYVATPTALPGFAQSEGPGTGVQLALADDLVNLALAGAWEAGILETGLEFDPAILGMAGAFDYVAVNALLPPMMDVPTNGGPSIMVGDLILELQKDGQAVAALAINATIELSIDVDANGNLVLGLDVPVANADVLFIADDADIDETVLLTMIDLALNQLGPLLSNTIGDVPLPAFESAELANVSVTSAQPDGGYALLGGNIVPR